MGLTLYQLNKKQDAIQFTEISVPIITKWMGLPRIEDPSWVCTYAMPDVHGLVAADLPRSKEYKIHVVIPYLYHLEDFPKLINIGWGVSVSEPKFTSDVVEEKFRHEVPEAIEAWICLLIKCGQNPQTLPLPSREGGN